MVWSQFDKNLKISIVQNYTIQSQFYPQVKLIYNIFYSLIELQFVDCLLCARLYVKFKYIPVIKKTRMSLLRALAAL
jgi:hypothetical protein